MKIKVRNFQSLSHVDLDVSGLTVLVGPSNWGKSALVRAITAALFNRPGEDFIRHGQTKAQVILEDLPTVTGTPLTVNWEKGHNLNQFTINGVEYKKVGLTAPPILQSSGYKDIFIGDKERQKGEEIRPQIGGQFDPPFLLKTLGSFVNDVLSVVSRLGVLLNANGRCAKDLKASRATLTVRQKDLKKAETGLAALQPVVDLHARVLALQTTLDEAKKVEALLLKVRGLVAGRAALKGFVDGATLPAATEVPTDLGVIKIQQGWDLMRRRIAALHVRVLTLPEHVADADAVTTAASLSWTKVGQGRALMALRTKLAPAAGLALDAVDTQAFVLKNLEKCDEWVQMRGSLQAAMATRAQATTAVYNAISALNGVETQQVEADSALAMALEGMTICPVCEQAMPVKTTAASV